MAFNLIRNSRVFFTTNVNNDGVVQTTGITTTNTWEIQVQEGLTFSQNTSLDTVTLNEAGATPNRGQRSFNTSLEPVDFSFATYIRPFFFEGGLNPDEIQAEESLLWNALAGTGAIGTAGAGWTTGASVSTVSFANSNAHQLQKFGMIIYFDGVTYIIDNCALDSATIDFGLDAIASIQWAGKGTAIRSVEGATVSTATDPVFASGITGTAKGKNVNAKYIANKLSTLVVQQGIGGTGTSYNIALTGGTITFSNNLTYLTPANLGVVNQPITYFTGVRAISGNITAYLRTGTNTSSDLLAALLAGSATDVDPEYKIKIEMGGSTNSNRMDIEIPAAMLSIPTIQTEQVISTQINFTAQGYTGTAYDIEQSNEATVKYYAVA